MANEYKIYFRKLNDVSALSLENAFFLPVNPEELTASVQSNDEDYNILALGPVIQARTPKLKTVSFSSYFPGRPDNIMLDREQFRPPEFYISFFESCFKNKDILVYIPVRVYENGETYKALPEEGFNAVITDWEYSEKAGETGDFYYSLELTEYKEFLPKKITLTGETQEGTQAAVAVTEKARDIPNGQLYVGAIVVVNGGYYYSSYGDEPHYQANGGTYRISRIVNDDPTRAYPIHITNMSGGALGWITRDSCRVVSGN